jgi:hypothetical protein
MDLILITFTDDRIVLLRGTALPRKITALSLPTATHISPDFGRADSKHQLPSISRTALSPHFVILPPVKY